MASDWQVADEALSKRLLDQHDVVVDAFGDSLLLFPFDLSQPNLKILESGCADGHWLKSLSSMSPNPSTNSYVGTDINSRFFPAVHPPEFQFSVHNVAEPWPSAMHNCFDIVHQRLSLPGAAPGSLAVSVKNLFHLVKPGGWLQLVEAEQTGPESGPVFGQFLDLVKQVFERTGAGWKYAGHMREWMEATGAVDVKESSVDMVFGAAHDDTELAEKGATCTAGAVEGLVTHAKKGPVMNLETDISRVELDTLASRLLVELREHGAHYPLRAVWGRKRS